MRIAVSQYPIEKVASFDAYSLKIARLVDEAANKGAQLLVFPEYAPVELTALNLKGGFKKQLHNLQKVEGAYLELHRALARSYDVVIVGGTFPELLGTGAMVNRAYVFGPSETAYQDKLHMMPWEEEAWGMSPGKKIKVFHAESHVFAINICLDAELPAQARRQALEGATLIVVPSSTDTLHAWNRVRIGCMARALENQCFVAMSPTIGFAEWSVALDASFGAAGVFCPPDEGFPENGVIAQGTLGEPGWVYADLDFTRLQSLREQGVVRTLRKAGDTVDILKAKVESFKFSRAWHGETATW